MNDEGRTVAPLPSQSRDLSGRRPYDTDIEDRAADFDGGLTNLGFIRAALRRGARLWCAIALTGLLAGCGVFVARPAAFQASASVLLPPPVYQGAILDSQAIAQSRAVAGLAVRRLRLPQTAASFATDYAVATPTDRLLVITANAASGAAAVREANGVAAAFLIFQAHLLKSQEQLTNAALQQQITHAEQHVNAIGQQISRLAVQPASSAQQARLATLRAEHRQAASKLAYLKQTNYSSQASAQSATTSQLKRSVVLDKAVPIEHSRKKRLLLYAVGGLLGGLVLGLGIVVIRALVSDRLRRRDDVARVIGAPVRLSVGKVRLSGLLGGRRGLAAAQQSPDIRRVVAHLRRVVPPGSRGPASLAVVPVDDVQVPAVCLASLAVSCAHQGMQVVVADLCGGAPAARLLGAAGPGIQEVTVGGAHLVAAVPEDDDVVPVGPLRRRARRAPGNEPLAAACPSADLLLTLAALDPSLGSEHLATWAKAAVAVVTAGKSSAARVNAAGEMIRLAGIPLISVVLVGADKTDESIGVTGGPGARHHGEGVREHWQPDAGSFFATVNGNPGGMPGGNR